MQGLPVAFTALQLALEQVHKDVRVPIRNERLRACVAHIARTQVTEEKFSIRDYVMVRKAGKVAQAVAQMGRAQASNSNCKQTSLRRATADVQLERDSALLEAAPHQKQTNASLLESQPTRVTHGVYL